MRKKPPGGGIFEVLEQGWSDPKKFFFTKNSLFWKKK